MTNVKEPWLDSCRKTCGKSVIGDEVRGGSLKEATGAGF